MNERTEATSLEKNLSADIDPMPLCRLARGRRMLRNALIKWHPSAHSASTDRTSDVVIERLTR